MGRFYPCFNALHLLAYSHNDWAENTPAIEVTTEHVGNTYGMHSAIFFFSVKL